jgi:hypothetical protein
MAQALRLVACTATASLIPVTGRGTVEETGLVEPVPSRPDEFDPRDAVVALVVLPSPFWPDVPWPQHHPSPFDRKAQVLVSPASTRSFPPTAAVDGLVCRRSRGGARRVLPRCPER